MNTRCAVNGVPEDVWQIKVTLNYHIVELVTNFMQKIIENIHTTWVFIGWPIAKTEQNCLPTSKRSSFGKIELLQLGFRFRFKFFDSFEGGCFDCDKNSTTTSIRPISPKYCKARMQYFRVADIQPCLIDAYNVRVSGANLERLSKKNVRET